MKKINEMTQQDFKSVKYRASFNNDIGVFEALVVLPGRKIRDSGYRCLDFVAVKDESALFRLSGYSDVVDFNGIGGYGEWTGRLSNPIPGVSWCMDCLPKSGLLRIWANGFLLKIGSALSTFELYAVKR